MAERRTRTDTDDGAPRPPLMIQPAPGRMAEQVGDNNIVGQFSAVINVHACNLAQIEAAIVNNLHEVDPHPIQAGKYVRRHPVYLAAFNPSELDEQGRPAVGEPAELDLKTLRRLYSSRFPHVSPDPPPDDGS